MVSSIFYCHFLFTININVDYFRNIWYTTNKNKEFYDKFKNIIVFGLYEKEFKNLEDDYKYMKRLINDVENLNKDPDFYQWMTDEEDIECQVNSSFIEGKEEGKNINRNDSKNNWSKC